MGILYIPFSGITSLFRENAHPISGKYIPNTGILYIPLSGIISLFWEKTISHFRELYPRKGKNKPIGLLQDTHFVHTKYILLGGKPLKPPFNNQRHLHSLLSMLTRGIYPFLHSLIIEVLHLCRIFVLKEKIKSICSFACIF